MELKSKAGQVGWSVTGWDFILRGRNGKTEQGVQQGCDVIGSALTQDVWERTRVNQRESEQGCEQAAATPQEEGQ